MKKTGTITPNGVVLKEHEYATVTLLTEKGFDVELIPKSNAQGVHTPDIRMLGLEWEIKSPQGKGKWVIKNIMQKAERQAENLIIDIRRLKQYPQEKYVNEIKQRFSLMKRFRRLIIVTKGNVLLDFQK